MQVNVGMYTVFRCAEAKGKVHTAFLLHREDRLVGQLAYGCTALQTKFQGLLQLHGALSICKRWPNILSQGISDLYLQTVDESLESIQLLV